MSGLKIQDSLRSAQGQVENTSPSSLFGFGSSRLWPPYKRDLLAVSFPVGRVSNVTIRSLITNSRLSFVGVLALRFHPLADRFDVVGEVAQTIPEDNEDLFGVYLFIVVNDLVSELCHQTITLCVPA